jgi:hypothetical protein
MNVTFERQKVIAILRAFKRSEDSIDTALRLTAAGDKFIIESAHGEGTVEAMVLEPGAFSTKLAAFDRLLRTYIGAQMLTLQADPTRFRIGGFSGQLSDYNPSPATSGQSQSET